MAAPQVGAIIGGYRFKGGDPNDRSSWEAVASQSGPPVGTEVGGYRFRGGDPNDKKSWAPITAAEPAKPAAPKEDENFLWTALKKNIPLFEGRAATTLEDLPSVLATGLSSLFPNAPLPGYVLQALGTAARESEAYKGLTGGTVQKLREKGERGLAELGPGQYGSVFDEPGITRKLGSLAETVTESALPTLAGLATGVVTRSPAAAATIMGAGNVPLTYGGIRETQKEQGIDDIQKAATGAAASAALDILTGVGGKVLGIAEAAATRQILEAGVRQAALRVVKSGRDEAGTEMLQNIIEQVAGGVDATTKQAMLETLESGLAGGFGGTVFTGATELAAAPFRPKKGEATERDIAASPQGIAEFQRLASEAVGEVMAANPGMSKNDAANIVAAQAEKLRIRAVANILGTEGDLDVDTRLDVTGGGRAGVPSDLEPGGAAVGAPELGEAVAGRLGEPVPSVPVSDVGTRAGEPALKKPTAKQVNAALPVVEQTFADAAIDFEENYGVTDLTGAQKKMAARMVVEGVDPYDAIDNLLQKQMRAPTPAAPVAAAPSVDEVATKPVASVIEAVATPTPGAAVPSLAETAAKQTGIAPAVPEAITQPEPLPAPQLAPEAQPTPTVAETLTEEKLATPATKTLNDLAGIGTVNPENTNEVLVEGGGVQLTPVADNVVQVDSLRAVEKGGGRKAMEQLVQTADANGTELQLSPEPFAAPAGKEMSPTELTEWYKGFGFQEQPDGSMVRPATSIMPSRQEYTPQQIVDNLNVFANQETQDRGYEPGTDEHIMFLEGVRDIQSGRKPLADKDALVVTGQSGLSAYKEGTQWAQDRIADAAKPVEGNTYEGVLADAQKRHDEGKLTPQGLQVIQERVEAAREAQAAGLDTRYTPDAVRDALDRMAEPEETVDISVAGDPVAEGEYMTDAVHEAAEGILNDFMVGDRVQVGSTPGIVVGLDGDYLRVHPDTASNPKAYNRVPKSSVTFVSRPDTATTVSASKVEGEDAKFGTEDGQLNADMAGLIQLLGANMYAANVADVSVKELLQNAFDAVKGAVSGKKMPSLYENGRIEITLNSSERTITIKDNARGMTPEIVRNAFFTVAGSDKSDLDPSERSGGLGLAKMGFMMGADWLKLDTVRDGVRVTVDATSKEIAGSDFKIVKSPAPEGKHGTTVTIKVPETYTDPKTGDQKNIWFPYSADSVGILRKPLIGPVEVQFTYERGYGDPETETLPLGVNFPYDDYQKLEAKFDWGSADIYYGKERQKYPSHQILSSGVYQFDERFKLNQNDIIPYNIIVNIKPAVEAKHPDYPFENSREKFKGRLKADIDSLGLYLVKIARGAEAADLKDTMKNVVSLPRIEAGEDIKGLEGKLKKSFEKGETSRKALPQLPTQVTISDLGVFDLGGRTVVDTVKEAEKKKASTFEAATEAPTRDDFMIELDQDPRNPIFHNNTNFDPIEVGTPYGDPAKFFAELGSLLVEMKEFMAQSGRWSYDQLSPDNMFYGGVAIDKQYGGLHLKVPYKALLINPFYEWGARTLAGVRANILNTMIHEIAHTGDMNHGEGHNSEMVKVEQYLADEGMLDYFRDAIMDTLLRHESAFTAMKEAYGRSTTQNIAKSLEDYGKQKSASREVGGTGDGGQDKNGAVPAGRGRGRGSDLQAAASASAEGEERGGTGGAGKPITDEAVDKAVSVKLTKAQMKRIEAAAGLQRKELNNMQKRIVQSRNTNETMGLIKRLTRLAHDTNDAGLVASIARSMPPSVYRAVLGFLQIETVFDLARVAGIKSLQKVDDMMRNGYIPYVNRIIMSAREIDEMWGAFAASNPEGNMALDDVIMISNMMNVDPTRAPTATDYMLIDEDLRSLQWKLLQSKDEKEKRGLKSQIGRRKADIERVYVGGEETNEAGETVQVAGYNDVPPEGRKIYKAARDFYRNNFDEHYRLLMQRIDDAGFDKEKAVQAKAFIKKMFDKARERVIYFPVKRFGEYWVSVGNDFYMRETLAEQKALVDRLKREGETRPITPGEGRQNLRNLVANKDASGALKDILDILDDGNTVNAKGETKIAEKEMDDLRDLIFQMYLTSLPEADMRRRFIHREFKTGFSTDALRTFATTAVASANQLGRLAYNYKFNAAIEEAKKETEENPLKPWLDAITNEVELKVKRMMAPQEGDALDAVIAFAGKLTFFNLLSAPSSAFMNLTQLHIVGLPVLSAEFGEAKTAAMASRYTASFLLGQEVPNPFRNEEGNLAIQMPDVRFENSGYMRRLKKSDPERYQQTLQAWEYANEHDIIESTFSAGANLYERSNVPTGEFNFRQAVRRGEVLTAAQRAGANTINALGFFFHNSEKIARSIMYMSSFDLAYERAIKQGKSAEEAGLEAQSTAAALTNKAMFDFSNWNKSRFAQSRLGRLALQMQSYRQSMYTLLTKSFVQMLPFMNKEGKLAAARIFFGVAGMTALYGGLRVTHISAMVLAAYTILKFVESLPDDDEDKEEEIEGGYLTSDTIEQNIMKFADKKGHELALKDVDYYIRAHFIPETFGRGGTLQNALNLKNETADKLATVADMGLPALGGVDLSNSVSLAEFWSPVETKGNTPEVRALETLARLGLGPTAATLGSLVKAGQAWNEGDINKGFEAILPAAVRNYIKSERLQSEGLRIGKNEDIVLKDTFYYTNGKAALISMGFRDAQTSREMQLDIMGGKVEDEVAAEQGKLLDRRYRAILDFNIDPTPENLNAWQATERDIAIYNLAYPSNAITEEVKEKSFKGKMDQAAELGGGLSFNTKIPVRQAEAEARAEKLLEGP